MLDLIFAVALTAQNPAPFPEEPDRCNAAGRAAEAMPGCTTWATVRQNSDGQGYVDTSSVRRDGEHVEMNVRLLLPQPVEDAHSINTRFRLNCTARTSLQTYIAAFDATGRVIQQGPLPPEAPHPIRPDTPYSVLLDRFCTR